MTGKKKACDRPATGQKGVARLKKKIAGDRPARTGRSETGSTGPPGGSTAFNQDGPGKDWLKTAELKFSC